VVLTTSFEDQPYSGVLHRLKPVHELLQKAGKSCGAIVKPGKHQRYDERLHYVV